MDNLTVQTVMECAERPSEGTLLLDGPLSMLVIVSGLFGNIYSLKQLFSRTINTVMLVSLTGLAIWDMMLLVTAFVHHSLWASLQYFNLRNTPWDQFRSSFNSLIECGYITSTWMLIEVTAERFFAVTRPFHFATVSRKQSRVSQLKLVLGLVKLPVMMTFVACIITIPCGFEYQLRPCFQDGKEYQMIHETSLLKNLYYRLLYKTIFMSVIVKTFGPFIIITCLTVSTMKGMRRSMDNRANILIQQGQDHLFQADKDKTRSLQMISMLLLGKFLLLRCWPTFMTLLQMSFDLQKSIFAVDMSNFTFLLNSATNSFVFVVVKSAFETRRLKKIRDRQRRLIHQHAAAVLSIGKALAGDKLLVENGDEESEEKDGIEMTEMLLPKITEE